MILNIIPKFNMLRKNVISGSFPVYKILKILFSILVHITKRRRIEF